MRIEHVLAEKNGDLITAAPDATLSEVAQILSARHVDLVMVTSPQQRLLGVVSERDILAIVAEDHTKLATLRAKDIMTTEPTTCSPEDLIQDVIAVMGARRFRHVPVTNHGKLTGLVTRGDLIGYLLAQSKLDVMAAAWSDLKYL